MSRQFVCVALFTLFCAMATLISAQVPFPYQCPDNIKPVDTFDANAYMGVWYEYTKYPFVFEVGKKCIYATYGLIDSSTVSVVNSAINRFTNSPSNATGTAKVLGPGQLAVTFSPSQRTDKANYQVLATDYKTYSVVYSCSNIAPFAHTKIVWILTRERKPAQETLKTATKVLEDNNISQLFLIDTLQDDCPDSNAYASGNGKDKSASSVSNAIESA